MSNPKPKHYNLPENAVWFITGSSSGIGLALAELIASHPRQRLVATSRNTTRLAGLLPSSERVHLVDLDVVSESSIANAVESAISVFGRIDVLVNNAGYGLMGDAESALLAEDQAKARKVVETDFWGASNLSLHAIRVFRDENPKTGLQGGVVLNVSSLGGFAGFPGSAYYHAAKFALEGFTESISKEVRPEWNIHFSLIEPGGTKTRFTSSASMEWLSPHAAYVAPDTPTRLLENYIKNPDMQKTWTPSERIAAAMYQLVARNDRPLPMRLPLSSGAWQVVKAEVVSVDKELDEVRELSESVDIDDLNKSGAFLTRTFK